MPDALRELSNRVSGGEGLDSDAQAALAAALGRPIPCRFLPPGMVPIDDDDEGSPDVKIVGGDVPNPDDARKREESPSKKPKVHGETVEAAEDVLMSQEAKPEQPTQLTPLSQQETQPWTVDAGARPARAREEDFRGLPGVAGGASEPLHETGNSDRLSERLPAPPPKASSNKLALSHITVEGGNNREQEIDGLPKERSPIFGRGGALSAPPVFAGAASPNHPPKPEMFHLDEPSWLPSSKAGIHELKDKQEQILAVADTNSREISSLKFKLDDMTPRVEAVEALANDHSRELRELKQEVQALRSRSVSPAPPVNRQAQGPSPPTTPRQDSRYDDLQIACGGWQDAKRHDIEQEITQAFEAAGGANLVHDIVVPYARSSFARIELNYSRGGGISEKRKIQTQVIKALKDVLPHTKIAGQEQRKVWFTRNRSPEERAKLRAILSTKEAMQAIRPQADVEHDWRGKVFVDGVNILFLAGPAPPPEAFLHTAARGDHSGWYVHTAKAAHVLGVSHQQVLDAMERTAGGA